MVNNLLVQWRCDWELGAFHPPFCVKPSNISPNVGDGAAPSGGELLVSQAPGGSLPGLRKGACFLNRATHINLRVWDCALSEGHLGPHLNVLCA